MADLVLTGGVRYGKTMSSREQVLIDIRAKHPGAQARTPSCGCWYVQFEGKTLAYQDCPRARETLRRRAEDEERRGRGL